MSLVDVLCLVKLQGQLNVCVSQPVVGVKSIVSMALTRRIRGRQVLRARCIAEKGISGYIPSVQLVKPTAMLANPVFWLPACKLCHKFNSWDVRKLVDST